MANGLAIAGGVTFPLLATGGTAAAPDYSFLGDTNTGMYRVAADSIGFSAGGALALTIGPSQITSALGIFANIFYAGYGLGASGGILVSDSAAGNSCLLSATANAPFGTTLAGLSLGSDKGVQWDASTAVTTGTPDLGLARLAAASLRQGLAPSATPVNQTFTIGESSRPGTDVNVGGADGYIRPGLGTGAGTPPSVHIQGVIGTASGSGAQTYGDVLVVGNDGSTNGHVYVKALSPHSQTILFVPRCSGGSGGGEQGFIIPTAAHFKTAENGTTYVPVYASNFVSSGYISATDVYADRVLMGVATGDVCLARITSASLRQGFAPSATPVAQTFTIGEFSRVGTDNNVAGSDGTIRSGSGTGNAAGSSLFFDTPTVGASGTVQQSYGHRLTLSALGATFDIPDQGLRINNQVNGAGASAGSLTNAPSAGNPNFWLPISIAGTTRYFPGW